MARLEKVQEALDEATLALEAIDPDGAPDSASDGARVRAKD